MNYITVDILKQISPRANIQIISDLADHLDQYFQKYQVNSYLRVCHFLAQAALESDGFKTLQEYASGKEYEGRKDLGNVNAGDGVRYKGRGIFQLTGRANYTKMSTVLGVDLVNNPDLAATGEISIQTAMEYWKSHNLNTYADQDDIMTITKKINGGYNGLDGRKAYLVLAKAVIPKNLSYAAVTATSQATSNPAPQDTTIVAKVGDNSPYVTELQNLLIKAGEDIIADGAYGPKTAAAVKDFQNNNDLPATGSIDTNTLNILKS